MDALAMAPGVLSVAMTTYVTVTDVMELLGCKENKAYQSIRKVNLEAQKSGQLMYGRGKANKYLFSEKFGIPIDIVNAVIENNKAKEG